MRTQPPRDTFRTIFGYISVILLLTVVINGCKGDIKTKIITSEGGEISLDSGGYIEIPEGAFPEYGQISIKEATHAPVLPDGVEPVGEALVISSTREPMQPVTLRLPIPQSVQDSLKLAIIRVESDGTTTVLMSSVEGDELVADTPGFSTFIVGMTREIEVAGIQGKPELLPGQRATYQVMFANDVLTITGTTWKVSSNASLVFSNDSAATVEAGNEEGWAWVSCEFIETQNGKRWYGFISFKIKEGHQGPSGFDVSVITRTPVIYSEEEILISAAVYGEAAPPITWTWDFGDGIGNGTETTGDNTKKLLLPAKTYKVMDSVKRYRVDVTAEDSKGRKDSGAVSVTIVPKPLSLTIDGPQRLTWKDPGISQKYTASASGGAFPYDQFSWRLFPSGWGQNREGGWGTASGSLSQSGVLIPFDEPGEHRLEVTVEDDDGKTTKAVFPILVGSGEPLSTHMLNLPETAKPGETITVNIQVRGGVMIVSGKKAGYTLKIDWGDGGEPVVEEDVGLTHTPYEGSVVTMSHTYSKAGIRQVKVEAFDATGSFANDSRFIWITDNPPNDPDEDPVNNRPIAESFSTKTKMNTSVPITLRGTDEDGDELTYLIESHPSGGRLSGSGVFQTYTPNSGFFGSDSFTYTVDDGKEESSPATVNITVDPLKWVRVGQPVINRDNLPTEYYGGGSTPYYYTEPRFEGKWEIYYVNETSIAKDDREMDHAFEYYNVNISSSFDAPPQELIPGETHALTVEFSNSGSVHSYPPSEMFEYRADRSGIIQPFEAFPYAPWHPGFTGENTKTWTLTVPQGNPGDTFEVYAFWWNCPVCNVTWTYEAQ